MKKQQKIIELRTAAKLKVTEIETKIAFARSEAAKTRASLMGLRADELDGLEAGGTERYDVLARYRSLLATVDARCTTEVAQLKAEIQQVKAECEKQCAAAEDDPETAKEQPQLQQQTVYVDGSEHSARIVARRIINKLPHIPSGGFLNVHIIEDSYADCHAYFVSVYYGTNNNFIDTIFAAGRHTAKFEADFFEKARRMSDGNMESGNSHVAEPMARALDAVFGGNPVEQVDNLISDTVKSGKEGGNE